MSSQIAVAGRRTFALVAIVLGIGTAVSGLVYWGVTLNPGESRYGSFDLPGETLVDLPAGRVDLSFTMDLSNQTVAIPILHLAITPVDGGPVPRVDGRMGAALSDNGVTHIRVGSAVIDRPGRYTVSATGGVSASPNPQLHCTSAKRTNPFPVVLTTLAIGLTLLDTGIVVLVRLEARKPG
ncbi:hypothetical protein [Nocardia sp. GAS34]|uniref:hypothetical protein n=1 Tax=unclassified Nocardia TaxID=2637762 RepID=UPI003D1F5A30